MNIFLRGAHVPNVVFIAALYKYVLNTQLSVKSLAIYNLVGPYRS